MSKITFRADDDLIDRLEALDASKSEIMREALRAYLDEHAYEPSDTAEQSLDRSLDALLADRVDAVLEDRLGESSRQTRAQDVNVTVSLEGDVSSATRQTRKTRSPEQESTDDHATHACGQCGESLDDDHVYCPNCGEKASRRVFCECGDELRSDWGFCPSCGRRTPAADVLDNR